MSRDQILKIAMVVCITVLLCAVIVTSTGAFGLTRAGIYADADKMTAGPAEITGEIRNLEISWTSGRVILLPAPGSTVRLEESAKRALSEDEKVQWLVDGDTLRIHFAKPGIRWNMPEKELTVMLPEGLCLQKLSAEVSSGDMEIRDQKAEVMILGSTSGDIRCTAEARHAEVNSTSGAQQLRLTGKTDVIRINSTSGDIHLETDQAEIIEAGSTSGSISITAEEGETVKAGSTSGMISTKLKKMKSLQLSATSGDVTAALPPDPGFTAQVTATSGRFTYGLALTRNGDEYICGDGSGQVKISTTSGNIRVDAAEK